MSVLVTGGAGYIGGHMALGLVDAGEKVVVVDNLSTGFAWGVPEGAKLVVGDFGDADLVARLIEEHEIDAIAHFAAKIVVPESVRDPLGYYLNNVSKARNLIECAVKGGVKNFIFSSTAAVYGETAAEPVAEETRACADFALWAVEADGRMDARGRRPGLRSALCRPALFQRRRRRSQGPPRPVDAQRHPSHQARRADRARAPFEDRHLRRRIIRRRDGTCVRDYIQVTDLIDAHMAALAYLRDGGAKRRLQLRLWHGETVKEVVEVVKRVSGVDFKVVVSPGGGRAIRPPSSARPTGQGPCLGWRPTRDDLDEIVRQALDWERRLHNRRTDGTNRRDLGRGFAFGALQAQRASGLIDFDALGGTYALGRAARMSMDDILVTEGLSKPSAISGRSDVSLRCGAVRSTR